MKLPRASLPLSIAALVVACGGTVSKTNGSSSAGGTAAGNSSSAGNGSEPGAGARGGAPSVGGTVGTTGGLSLGGAPSCATVDCATVDCQDDEVPVLAPGACCATCQPRANGCEAVKCQPITDCGDGYELAQPPGACCVGCVPKPGGVACREIACPETSCAPGYVRGDVLGGCCYDCVPDPLYCREDADCVLADKPRACCGCPEAITRRQFEAEPCWFEPGGERSIPSTCYPDTICDAACGPCSTIEAAKCRGSRCTSRHDGLK